MKQAPTNRRKKMLLKELGNEGEDRRERQMLEVPGHPGLVAEQGMHPPVWTPCRVWLASAMPTTYHKSTRNHEKAN